MIKPIIIESVLFSIYVSYLKYPKNKKFYFNNEYFIYYILNNNNLNSNFLEKNLIDDKTKKILKKAFNNFNKELLNLTILKKILDKKNINYNLIFLEILYHLQNLNISRKIPESIYNLYLILKFDLETFNKYKLESLKKTEDYITKNIIKIKIKKSIDKAKLLEDFFDNINNYITKNIILPITKVEPNTKLYYRKEIVNELNYIFYKANRKHLIIFGKKNTGMYSVINNLITYIKKDETYIIIEPTKDKLHKIENTLNFLNSKNKKINLIFKIILETEDDIQDKEIQIIKEIDYYINRYNNITTIVLVSYKKNSLEEYLDFNKININEFANEYNLKNKNFTFYLYKFPNKNELLKILLNTNLLDKIKNHYDIELNKKYLTEIMLNNEFDTFNELLDIIDKDISKNFYFNEKLNSKNPFNYIDLDELKFNLKKQIFGQEQVINKIISKFELIKYNFYDINKPVASFMFSGNSGTGKTETAKQLAKFLNRKFLRFNMSEFSEKYSISTLIGSTPGYRDSDKETVLFKTLKKHPDTLILLDEIEKACPEIIKLFLQILDEGIITSGMGEKLNLKEAIIIFTTNAGANSHLDKETGFISTKIEKRSKDELKKVFPLEFLGRIDDILYFNEIKDKEIINKIIISKLQKIGNFIVGDKALNKLIELGVSKEFGVREIEKIIDTNIKFLLIKEMKKNKITLKDIKTFYLGYDKEFYITISKLLKITKPNDKNNSNI